MVEMQSKAPGLAPVSIDGFEFPDSVYFSTRLPSLLEGFQQAGSAGIDEKAEGYLKSFFKRITVSWPTHGSQMALYAQAEIIFRRLYPHLRTSLNLPTLDGRRNSDTRGSQRSSGGLARLITNAASEGNAPQRASRGSGSQSPNSKDVQSQSSVDEDSPVRNPSAASILKKVLKAEKAGNMKQAKAALNAVAVVTVISTPDPSHSGQSDDEVRWEECV